MRLYQKTAGELSAMLRNKVCSAVELLADVQQRLYETEAEIGAYITLNAESMQQARAVDDARARGENLHPLAGIPVAVKDNISTRGLRTTCASRMLEQYIPPYDADAVEKLKKAGMVILGKTNMDEFAMGSSTETSCMQLTRNPRNLACVPGGSSGGSAAAVASGSAILALGSDTGGSVRQPAAFCGCVGLKPTYGSVSRYGLIAHASSLDQIGPLTRDVADAALLFHLLRGHDPRDASSAARTYSDAGELRSPDVSGLRIGIPKEYFTDAVDIPVKEAVMQALRVLEAKGAVLREISLPLTAYAVSTYYILAAAEASSNLARYDGVRYGYRSPDSADLKEMYAKTRSEGFGREVKRRIMLGTFVLSADVYAAYYQKAAHMRRRISNMLSEALLDCDVIAAPTAPTPAFRIGEKQHTDMYAADFCTVTANLTGLPAISIPCGKAGEGMPIGMQLMGRPFAEAVLLRTAYTYEQNGGMWQYDNI